MRRRRRNIHPARYIRRTECCEFSSSKRKPVLLCSVMSGCLRSTSIWRLQLTSGTWKPRGMGFIGSQGRTACSGSKTQRGGSLTETIDTGRDDTAAYWLYQMRDRFLLMVLPLLLHLIPLIATVISWILGRRSRLVLSKRRRALFQAGVLMSLLSLLLTASCWLNVNPLVFHSDGSASIRGLELAWTSAFIAALTSTILAVFGKGPARILLASAGALTLALAYGALLQNGI